MAFGGSGAWEDVETQFAANLFTFLLFSIKISIPNTHTSEDTQEPHNTKSTAQHRHMANTNIHDFYEPFQASSFPHDEHVQ